MDYEALRAYRHLARYLQADTCQPSRQRQIAAATAIKTLAEAVGDLMKEREILERDRDTARFDCEELREKLWAERKERV